MTVLIIGGVFQGKLEYATKTYHLTPADILDFGESDAEWNSEKRCINHLQLFIHRLLREGKSSAQIEETLLPLLSDKIVICDDISCGIVPLDPFEREFRETVGRVLCGLAAVSDEVVRVQCGIPQIIKGANR